MVPVTIAASQWRQQKYENQSHDNSEQAQLKTINPHCLQDLQKIHIITLKNQSKFIIAVSSPTISQRKIRPLLATHSCGYVLNESTMPPFERCSRIFPNTRNNKWNKTIYDYIIASFVRFFFVKVVENLFMDVSKLIYLTCWLVDFYD